MQIYIVKPGDTVYSIAASSGSSVDSILYNNQLTWPYTLAVGQALLLPTDSGAVPSRTITANGYAYPFIDSYVLDQTLPYLTYLSVFSYGFTAQGNLVPPVLDDTPLIAAALQAGTAPVLTLVPLGPDGLFNNYLITSVVNNPAAVQTLIFELTALLPAKGYRSVDIDFEYILPEDRVPFADFVASIRSSVNALGYPVSVALAPKTSDDQAGLLYEGKDYALLGEAADSVLLMTYEWGYTYGPPMAVAPLNKVREVVEYALTRIPSYKIDLGIPNYGYDWTLPYERGVSRAVTIGNIEAVQIAVENHASIQFDPVAMSPFIQYSADGIEHEVWFEDVRSLSEKYALVDQYHLRGIGVWQIMKLFRAAWLLLDDTYLIFKT